MGYLCDNFGVYCSGPDLRGADVIVNLDMPDVETNQPIVYAGKGISGEIGPVDQERIDMAIKAGTPVVHINDMSEAGVEVTVKNAIMLAAEAHYGTQHMADDLNNNGEQYIQFPRVNVAEELGNVDASSIGPLRKVLLDAEQLIGSEHARTSPVFGATLSDPEAQAGVDFMAQKLGQIDRGLDALNLAERLPVFREDLLAQVNGAKADMDNNQTGLTNDMLDNTLHELNKVPNEKVAATEVQHQPDPMAGQ